MKYIKTYEERWYMNKNNIGEIVKRQTYNNQHYVFYLITDINFNKNSISAIFIGSSSANFENIKLKHRKEDGIQKIDNWFKNEYELLKPEESDKLAQEINNYDNEDYFEYIKNTTNMDLKDYVIRKDIKKYNI